MVTLGCCLPGKSRRGSSLLLLLLALLALFVPAGYSQNDAPVHLAPRTGVEGRHRSASVETSGDLNAHGKPIRVDVNLVLVPVTVTDQMNRLVTTLDKEDFSLYEGEQQQEIRYFSREDAPISVGLIVDLSGSMGNKIDSVHEAVDDFFRNANPEDDYFVVTVSDTPKIIGDTTQSIGSIQEKLALAPPGGCTALLDAIYLGETKLRSARYRRRALLIISDGGDNVSRYTLGEIKGMVQESDAQVYAIGLFDGVPVFRTIEEKFGKHLLNEITEASGGRTIGVNNAAKLPKVAATISRELRSQYILGYQPKKGPRDGKWRKIKVKVTAPEHASSVQAFYKKGYPGPEE
jgi:Ca-activated chloride channel homolog